MNPAPVLLTLFGGGGGDAEGYRRAGFRVIGVDIEDHSRAFARIGCEFHQMDWREGLRRFAHLTDAVHASPPCQRYSVASRCRPGLAAKYPTSSPRFARPCRRLASRTSLRTCRVAR